jgi:hypothetical protein
VSQSVAVAADRQTVENNTINYNVTYRWKQQQSTYARTTHIYEGGAVDRGIVNEPTDAVT